MAQRRKFPRHLRRRPYTSGDSFPTEGDLFYRATLPSGIIEFAAGTKSVGNTDLAGCPADGATTAMRRRNCAQAVKLVK